MIIDFHTHYYPDKIVEKALSFSSAILQPYTKGTRTALLESMAAAGIDYALSLPLVNTPSNSRGVNAWAIKENHGKILQLGSVHPEEEDPLGTLEMIAEAGLPGIKVHPEYQKFHFSDPKYFPIWQRCADLGLFVLTHAGADLMYRPPFHSDPAEIAQLIARFPRLTVVAAHLGGMSMWDEVERHLAGKEVYLDIAFLSAKEIDPGQLCRIIGKHGADKILYGSDSPWAGQTESLAFFRSLGLSQQQNELILCQNARRLLGKSFADRIK